MGNDASGRPSTSVEDYVKVIYDLQERGSGPVTISGMAERLAVSNSSVSGMLRKLSELGLVEHQRYGDVHLTDTGTKAALAVLRRHRLLETYLVEALGYSWDEVHDEARSWSTWSPTSSSSASPITSAIRGWTRTATPSPPARARSSSARPSCSPRSPPEPQA